MMPCAHNLNPSGSYVSSTLLPYISGFQLPAGVFSWNIALYPEFLILLFLF